MVKPCWMTLRPLSRVVVEFVHERQKLELASAIPHSQAAAFQVWRGVDLGRLLRDQHQATELIDPVTQRQVRHWTEAFFSLTDLCGTPPDEASPVSFGPRRPLLRWHCATIPRASRCEACAGASVATRVAGARIWRPVLVRRWTSEAIQKNRLMPHVWDNPRISTGNVSFSLDDHHY